MDASSGPETLPQERWTAEAKFARTLSSLGNYLDAPIREERDVAGILHGFALCVECAWRAVQEKVAAMGFPDRGPKPVLRAAWRAGLLRSDDDATLIALIDARNLVGHTYRPEWATEFVGEIRERFHPALVRLLGDLQGSDETRTGCSVAGASQ